MLTFATMQEVTGFSSWFNLYKFLVSRGYDKQEFIKCLNPRSETVGSCAKDPGLAGRHESEYFTFSVQEIKANAMDEVYNNLPTLAQSFQIINAVQTIFRPRRAPAIVEVAEKLPTKDCQLNKKI